MKRLGELTIDDLLDHGVWKMSLRAKVIEPNDGVVSPWRKKSMEGYEYEEFVVRCRFAFADGSGGIGYCQPTCGKSGHAHE